MGKSTLFKIGGPIHHHGYPSIHFGGKFLWIPSSKIVWDGELHVCFWLHHFPNHICYLSSVFNLIAFIPPPPPPPLCLHTWNTPSAKGSPYMHCRCTCTRILLICKAAGTTLIFLHTLRNDFLALLKYKCTLEFLKSQPAHQLSLPIPWLKQEAPIVTFFGKLNFVI